MIPKALVAPCNCLITLLHAMERSLELVPLEHFINEVKG